MNLSETVNRETGFYFWAEATRMKVFLGLKLIY